MSKYPDFVGILLIGLPYPTSRKYRVADALIAISIRVRSFTEFIWERPFTLRELSADIHMLGNDLSFRTGDHFSKLIRSIFPVDQNCFDCIPPPELLMLSKSAVWKYNQEHGSHNLSFQEQLGTFFLGYNNKKTDI